jgi:UPF0042 nucleotide-binding protein
MIDVDKPALFVVTGLSGSGKTTALKTFEDLGCEVMDNVPLSLCAALSDEKSDRRILALGIDVRTRGFTAQDSVRTLSHLRQHSVRQMRVLFFESDTDSLAVRYRDSRRQHPLGIDLHMHSLIERERTLMQPLRDMADHIMNTSHFSPPELKQALRMLLGSRPDAKPVIYILSFSFRRGIPPMADCLFDMRFLPNPYYHKDMKHLTGKSQEVRAFFQNNTLAQSMQTHVEALIDHMVQDPRPSFVIAFGCSGGKHRSVFMAEALSTALEAKGYSTHTHHRDLF